ncbi:hypothetical protein Tco_1190203 [Tanacetum coccineum]
MHPSLSLKSGSHRRPTSGHRRPSPEKFSGLSATRALGSGYMHQGVRLVLSMAARAAFGWLFYNRIGSANRSTTSIVLEEGTTHRWEHIFYYCPENVLGGNTYDLAMSSDNASSAVTYTSISSDSDGPSWGIPLMNAGDHPEMDPYEEVAQQGHAPPLSPAYVPDPMELDEHVPVYVPEPEHHVPSDDDIQVEDQPYAEDASPTAESPGYIADSDSMEEDTDADSIDYLDEPEDGDEDPEEDDDEDPEEDPSEEHDPEDDDEDPEEDPNEEHESEDEDTKEDEPFKGSDETELFEEDETAATPPPPGRHGAKISVKLQTPMAAST